MKLYVAAASIAAKDRVKSGGNVLQVAVVNVAVGARRLRVSAHPRCRSHSAKVDRRQTPLVTRRVSKQSLYHACFPERPNHSKHTRQGGCGKGSYTPSDNIYLGLCLPDADWTKAG